MNFKYQYYDTPPCPKCKSDRTGIITYGKPNDKRATLHYLQCGNYVRFYPDYKKGDHNCFCIDCNFSWLTDIQTLRLSKEEIAERAKEKGINAQMIAHVKEYTCFCQKQNKNMRKYQKRQSLLFNPVIKMIAGKVEKLLVHMIPNKKGDDSNC